jgi:hypothetical protein
MSDVTGAKRYHGYRMKMAACIVPETSFYTAKVTLCQTPCLLSKFQLGGAAGSWRGHSNAAGAS